MDPVRDILEKAKKYLKPGMKAPDGIREYQGKRGGRYYLTEELHAARGTTPKKRLPAFRTDEKGTLYHRVKTGLHGPGRYEISHHSGGFALHHIKSDGTRTELGQAYGGNPLDNIRYMKKMVDQYKSGKSTEDVYREKQEARDKLAAAKADLKAKADERNRKAEEERKEAKKLAASTQRKKDRDAAKADRKDMYEDLLRTVLLSKSDEKQDYEKAKKEWSYDGEVVDHGPGSGKKLNPPKCNLCGHNIRYGYILNHKDGERRLEVGSECITNHQIISNKTGSPTSPDQMKRDLERHQMNEKKRAADDMSTAAYSIKMMMRDYLLYDRGINEAYNIDQLFRSHYAGNSRDEVKHILDGFKDHYQAIIEGQTERVTPARLEALKRAQDRFGVLPITPDLEYRYRRWVLGEKDLTEPGPMQLSGDRPDVTVDRLPVKRGIDGQMSSTVTVHYPGKPKIYQLFHGAEKDFKPIPIATMKRMGLQKFAEEHPEIDSSSWGINADSEMHPVFPVKNEDYAHVERQGTAIRGQGFETLIAINGNGDQAYFKNGKELSVEVDAADRPTFILKRVIHNHPSFPSRSLSGPDLKFAFNNKVKEMWVYGKDGSVYLALPPEGEDYFGHKSNTDEMVRQIEEAENDTRNKLTDMIEDKEMTIDEANQHHADVVAKLLHARGVMRYYADYSGRTGGNQ